MDFLVTRIKSSITFNEKISILICGPSGSGKSFVAKKALNELERSFFSISFSDLVSSSRSVFESPRQRLKTILETALIDNKAVIINRLDELIEEPGIWFLLTQDGWFNRFHNSHIPLICTFNSETNTLASIKDHFIAFFSCPKYLQPDKNIRFADLKALKREVIITGESEESCLGSMIIDGRTCSQLSNELMLNMPSLKAKSNENVLTLDQVYGLKLEIKRLLEGAASFSNLKFRGALLYGPPGTGKTRLALALSGSLGSGTRFISLAASDILEAEVGSSEAKLRETFALARASQPALIFFDEIDALFPQNPSFHLLSLQHQLIAEFDALALEEHSSGPVKIFVLAASNFRDKVCERVLGFDRLELQIEIGLPNYEERLEIFEKELLKSDDESIDHQSVDKEFLMALAQATDRKSPADLCKIVQDARKRAQNRSAGLLKNTDFSDVFK